MNKMKLTGFKDKKFGLLGEHLSHSFSPEIHSLLADYDYGLYEVEKENLGEWVRSNNLAGYNVTIPYKQEIIQYCDELSERAKTIGAVNTIVRRADGTLFGDNTDYFGFEYMLSKLSLDLEGKKAVVLGSGGASKTVQTVLAQKGVKVVVVSRKGEDNYHNIDKHKDAALVVNATPVGMYPNCPASPVDLTIFEDLQGACDLIYNPSKTEFLLQAQEMGVPCVNGLSMLVAQAKAAAEVFLSTDIDNSVIENIIKEISSKTLNLILVGMPGCGKSTVGKLVAEKLCRKFFDTDEEIERSTGKSPSGIIKSEGEAAFRKIEEMEIRKLSRESSLVVATGGGAVTVETNRRLLHQNGVVVFIDRDTDKLSTQDRPLSVNLPLLYEKRLPMYESFAHIKVDGNAQPEVVAERILSAFSEVLL